MAMSYARTALFAVCLLFLGLAASGCGYRFAPAGEKIGRDIRRVYVGVFANNTAEAGIETIFRNAFVDQFIKGRRFRIVSDEASADAVLKGNIKNLVISHLAYRGDNVAVEKRITVTLSLALEEKGAIKALRQEENYSLWADYAFDIRNLSAEETSRANALVRLANDVAERAYRLMVSDF